MWYPEGFKLRTKLKRCPVLTFSHTHPTLVCYSCDKKTEATDINPGCLFLAISTRGASKFGHMSEGKIKKKPKNPAIFWQPTENYSGYSNFRIFSLKMWQLWQILFTKILCMSCTGFSCHQMKRKSHCDPDGAHDWMFWSNDSERSGTSMVHFHDTGTHVFIHGCFCIWK